MPIMKQPDIWPVHNPIFETRYSLRDVIIEAQNALEGMTPNELRTWFGVYHNTLISTLNQAE